MNRIQRFKFLSLFGDGLEHHWFEVIFLGCQYLKIRQKQFEKEIFERALAYGFIRRIETPEIVTRRDIVQGRMGIQYIASWEDYNYKITPIGDAILRDEQISRDGDVPFYQNYDRTLHGEYGLDRYAPLPKYLKKQQRYEQTSNGLIIPQGEK